MEKEDVIVRIDADAGDGSEDFAFGEDGPAVNHVIAWLRGASGQTSDLKQQH
jgi:hypothetical protein